MAQVTDDSAGQQGPETPLAADADLTRPPDDAIVAHQNEIRTEASHVPYVGDLQPLEDLRAGKIWSTPCTIHVFVPKKRLT